MKQNRLSKLISTLSKAEIKEFDKWLSMRCAESSDLYTLWNYSKNILKKKGPKYLDLSNEAIGALLNKSDKKKYIQNLRPSLIKYLEEYLIYQSIQDNELEFFSKKMMIYNSRGLHHHANLIKDDLYNRYENRKNIGLWDEYMMQRMNHELYFSDNPIKYENGKELMEKLIHNHGITSKSLSSFYLAEIETRISHFHENYTSQLDTLHSLTNLPVENDLVHYLTLYHRLISQNDPDSFEQLYQYLISEENRLSPNLELVITITLIQFLRLRISLPTEGKENLRKMYHLYNWGIERGTLLNNGQLSTSRFINLIDLISYHQEFEKAEDFINNYGPVIDSKQRKEVCILARSIVFFFKENYNEVLLSLRNIKLSYPVHDLFLREQVIISLYETENDNAEFILSKISTHLKWLNRNESDISKSNIEGSQNLMKFIEVILKTKDVRKWKKVYEEASYFRKKSWASKKIDEKR